MLGIKPGAAGSGSKYSNHCAILPPNFIPLLSVYFETGRQTNAGSIQINIGSGTTGQSHTWKVMHCSKVEFDSKAIRCQVPEYYVCRFPGYKLRLDIPC